MPSYSKTPKGPEAPPTPLKEGQRWLREHNIPYEVRSDGVTVATGDIKLRGKSLTKLPFADIIPWEVTGSFDCSENQLTNLQGAPQSVGEKFNCSYNLLPDLQGGPQTVGGHYRCNWNEIKSLLGAPQSVGKDLACAGNQLVSLSGLEHSKVRGRVWAGNNPIVILDDQPPAGAKKVSGLPRSVWVMHRAVQGLDL